MRCELALALCFALSASLSAQAPPSASSTSPREGQAATSPKLEGIAGRLLQLSTELSSEAGEQSTELKELKSSLEVSQSALALSQVSLEKAEGEARAHSLEAALWRIGTLAGGLGVAGALLDVGQPRGAAIGAIVGGALGAVWWLIEHGLPW